MRLMGMDLGEKTIGIAISDELGWTAQGLEVIRRTNLTNDFGRLKEIVKEKQVTKIIMGLPRRTDGSYGPETDKVKDFVVKMEKEIPIPVEYWDERFSTVAAERVLLEGDVRRKKRRQVIDMVAACVILQAYLDRS